MASGSGFDDRGSQGLNPSTVNNVDSNENSEEDKESNENDSEPERPLRSANH